MFCNKKGSLEISIQAIIIVVLAMTLLGLGLGFIKGMFRNITGTTEDVTEQVRQKVLDDLIQGDKKISFPKTEVSVDKGSSTVLTVGVRNKGDSTLYYQICFQTMKGPSTITSTELSTKLAQFNNGFQYNKNHVYTLGNAQSDVRNIRLKVPVIASGSYFVKFYVLKNQVGASGAPTAYTITGNDCLPGTAEVYASKDFFVVVRG